MFINVVLIFILNIHTCVDCVAGSVEVNGVEKRHEPILESVFWGDRQVGESSFKLLVSALFVFGALQKTSPFK